MKLPVFFVIISFLILCVIASFAHAQCAASEPCGRYWNGTACVLTPKGYYAATDRVKKAAAPGHYVNYLGACYPQNAGYGYFTNTSAATMHLGCWLQHGYNNAYAQSSCLPCDVGSDSYAHSIYYNDSWTYAGRGCVPCFPGRVAAQVYSETWDRYVSDGCRPVSPGYYKPRYGRGRGTLGIKCPRGFHSNGDAPRCMRPTMGWFAPHAGTATKQLEPCGPGESTNALYWVFAPAGESCDHGCSARGGYACDPNSVINYTLSIGHITAVAASMTDKRRCAFFPDGALASIPTNIYATQQYMLKNGMYDYNCTFFPAALPYMENYLMKFYSAYDYGKCGWRFSYSYRRLCPCVVNSSAIETTTTTTTTTGAAAPATLSPHISSRFAENLATEFATIPPRQRSEAEQQQQDEQQNDINQQRQQPQQRAAQAQAAALPTSPSEVPAETDNEASDAYHDLSEGVTSCVTCPVDTFKAETSQFDPLTGFPLQSPCWPCPPGTNTRGLTGRTACRPSMTATATATDLATPTRSRPKTVSRSASDASPSSTPSHEPTPSATAEVTPTLSGDTRSASRSLATGTDSRHRISNTTSVSESRGMSPSSASRSRPSRSPRFSGTPSASMAETPSPSRNSSTLEATPSDPPTLASDSSSLTRGTLTLSAATPSNDSSPTQEGTMTAAETATLSETDTIQVFPPPPPLGLSPEAQEAVKSSQSAAAVAMSAAAAPAAMAVQRGLSVLALVGCPAVDPSTGKPFRDSAKRFPATLLPGVGVGGEGGVQRGSIIAFAALVALVFLAAFVMTTTVGERPRSLDEFHDEVGSDEDEEGEEEEEEENNNAAADEELAELEPAARDGSNNNPLEDPLLMPTADDAAPPRLRFRRVPPPRDGDEQQQDQYGEENEEEEEEENERFDDDRHSRRSDGSSRESDAQRRLLDAEESVEREAARAAARRRQKREERAAARKRRNEPMGPVKVSRRPMMIYVVVSACIGFWASSAGLLLGTLDPGDIALSCGPLVAVFIYGAWTQIEVARSMGSETGIFYTSSSVLAHGRHVASNSEKSCTNPKAIFESTAGRALLIGNYVWSRPRGRAGREAQTLLSGFEAVLNNLRGPRSSVDFLNAPDPFQKLRSVRVAVERSFREAEERRRRACDPSLADAQRVVNISRMNLNNNNNNNNGSGNEASDGGGKAAGGHLTFNDVMLMVDDGDLGTLPVRTVLDKDLASRICPHYTLIAWAFAAAVGLLEGLGLSFPNSCPQIARAICALNVLSFFLLLWLRPFTIPLRNWVTIVIEAVVALTSVLAVTLLSANDGAPSKAVSEIAVTVQVVTTMTAMVGGALVVSSSVVRFLYIRCSRCRLASQEEMWAHQAWKRMKLEQRAQREEEDDDGWGELRRPPRSTASTIFSMLSNVGRGTGGGGGGDESSDDDDLLGPSRAAAGGGAGGAAGGGASNRQFRPAWSPRRLTEDQRAQQQQQVAEDNELMQSLFVVPTSAGGGARSGAGRERRAAGGGTQGQSESKRKKKK